MNVGPNLLASLHYIIQNVNQCYFYSARNVQSKSICQHLLDIVVIFEIYRADNILALAYLE